MNPSLDRHSKEIQKFEDKAEFQGTSKKKLLEWLKKEIKNYEKAKTIKQKEDKLIDIIILTMQLANRDHASLDNSWQRWFKKSEKYLE